MTALRTKYSVVSTFKKQVLVSEATLIKRKRDLSLEISRYLFASPEVSFVIIANQYTLS